MKLESVTLSEKDGKKWQELFKREVDRYVNDFDTLGKDVKDTIILKGIQRKLSEVYNTAAKKLNAIALDSLNITAGKSNKLTKADKIVVKNILKNTKDLLIIKTTLELSLGKDKAKVAFTPIKQAFDLIERNKVRAIENKTVVSK